MTKRVVTPYEQEGTTALMQDAEEFLMIFFLYPSTTIEFKTLAEWLVDQYKAIM